MNTNEIFRKLPPLNALRAFEASGRHLSFTKASDELGVTPAAVSHQVRQLEEYLGVSLFQRLTRAVRLTDAGQSSLPLMTEGFDKLAEAVAVLQSSEQSGVLTVSVTPAFASKWLIPRVERFTTIHPDIDLRISAGMKLADFRSDLVDVAIRYGKGQYPGLRAEKLYAESVTPMCSPALLEGTRPLRTPADLRHHTLLHDETASVYGPTPDWRVWLKLAGYEDVDANRGTRFSHAADALQAAIGGLGVVLGRESLAASDIAAGRLIRPFELTLQTDFAYYLVRPDVAEDRPKVAAFRAWVLEEVRRDDESSVGTSLE